MSILAEAELNLNLSLLSTSFMTHHSPSKFNFELLVELDVSWMDFSSFESSTPHYEFAEEVPDWVRTLMSMNNFPGAGFHDIYVPRFGAEFLLNKYLTLRGGYWYQPTPVPDQRGITNYADAEKNGYQGRPGRPRGKLFDQRGDIFRRRLPQVHLLGSKRDEFSVALCPLRKPGLASGDGGHEEIRDQEAAG